MEARVAGGEATEDDDNHARLTSDQDMPNRRSSSLEDSPVGMEAGGHDFLGHLAAVTSHFSGSLPDLVAQLGLGTEGTGAPWPTAGSHAEGGQEPDEPVDVSPAGRLQSVERHLRQPVATERCHERRFAHRHPHLVARHENINAEPHPVAVRSV